MKEREGKPNAVVAGERPRGGAMKGCWKWRKKTIAQQLAICCAGW
jgi:hypothetical protein